MSGRIAIVDYGMGNLHSVRKAFAYLGYDAQLIARPQDLSGYAAAVLPGVGAFCDAMNNLRSSGMDEAFADFVRSGKPALGICLGLQMLFETSLEGGEHAGLGLLPGVVRPISAGEKVPHMGWNKLDIHKEAPLFTGLPKEAYVYFVHSFYADCPADIAAASCVYGGSITAAVGADNLWATQFHPEKSGEIGLAILRNFGALI